MKIVAITQRIDYIESYGEFRDCLDQQLPALVNQCGYIAIPVPNTAPPNQWLDQINPDACILSGGNDIGQYPLRDNLETDLLEWAKNRNKPVLGICRGMQVMATHDGGKLSPVDGHVATLHSVNGKINRFVNSYHTKAILECPPNYTITAKCDDGVIEAIKHKKLKWEGWMWHPERNQEFLPEDIQRIKDLFK